MLCFHGTTKKGLQAILSEEGFKPSSPWMCSDNDGAMYFWPANKIASCNGLDLDDEDDEDDEEQVNYYGFESAFNSAICQAVTTLETELFVLVCDIPDELLQDDYSCENMADIASFIEQGEFSKEFIREIYTVNVNQFRLPYEAACLLRNTEFNKWSLNNDLLEMAEALVDAEVYLEPIEYNEEKELYQWQN